MLRRKYAIQPKNCLTTGTCLCPVAWQASRGLRSNRRRFVRLPFVNANFDPQQTEGLALPLDPIRQLRSNPFKPDHFFNEKILY